MRFFYIFFLMVSFKSYGVTLDVRDGGDSVLFYIVGGEENVTVRRGAFILGAGLNLDIKGELKAYSVSAVDNPNKKPDDVILRNQMVVGRVVSKHLMSIVYGIKDVGIYRVSATLCFDQGQCVRSEAVDITFSEKDIPR